MSYSLMRPKTLDKEGDIFATKPYSAVARGNEESPPPLADIFCYAVFLKEPLNRILWIMKLILREQLAILCRYQNQMKHPMLLA